jgi:hypothetical protein
MARVRESRPDLNPTGLSWKADPAAPVTLSMGREGVFLNPHIGGLLR